MTPGFHWYVAWRYLMVRPRRWSTSVMAVSITMIGLTVMAVLLGAFLLEPKVVDRFYDPSPHKAFRFWKVAAQCLLVSLTGGAFLVRRGVASHRLQLRAGAMTLAAIFAAVAIGLFFWRDTTLALVAPTRQQVWLIAVGTGALGWLALVLLIVRYYFTFFTTVSIAGVAIGVMALVIVLSVMSGFEADLRQKILGSNAHIQITKEEGELTEYRDLEAKLDRVPGVVAHTPYATSEVVIAANSNYATVIIKGIDPKTVGRVTELASDLKDPKSLGRLYPLPPEESAGTAAPSGKPDKPARPDRPDRPERDAGPSVDPAPGDFGGAGEDPIDFSGDGAAGADAAPPAPSTALRRGAPPPAEVVDPAPDDFVADAEAPIDFSTAGAIDGVTHRVGRPGGLDDLEDPTVSITTAPQVSPRVAALSGVLVGRELVKQIHLYTGQEVRMVSPLSDPSNPGGIPVPYTRNYRIAGSFFTGMYEYDLKFVYVELGSLQDFLDLGDQVNGIEVRISDPDVPGPVVAAIQRSLGPAYRVQDWKELNRNLFSALKLEKIAMFLVLAIIILVASFSIVGNLIMVVVEKAKEIALLKTLGASDSGVTKIFVTQGFFIGAVGTLLGTFHGLLACELGKRFGLPLDPDVYYIDRLPIHEDAASIAAIVFAGLLISVVATLYPAVVAARLRPVEGLRHQ
jgi:lipoprotein-releasing system permease protein